MVSKPAALTAATGMDALTHAVEALVTPWCLRALLRNYQLVQLN